MIASQALPRSNDPAISTRLLCVDILRGLAVAGMILVDNPGDDNLAYSPIQHAKWNGWTPADFIFPSFLLLVGVSMAYSFSARLQRGETRRSIFLHAIKRALLLILIGILVNGFPVFHIHEWRIEGVLQRIALCYLFSAILVLWSDWRGQLAAILVCLFGYWALMRFVPVPGFGVPGRDIPFLDPERNIVAWLDRKLFMGRLYDGVRDPEGILSNMPAIATALIGVLAGQWLRSAHSKSTKAFYLVLFGAFGLGAGLLWHRWFPINKNLWTSSFVVFAAGFTLVSLAFLYWVTEIQLWRGKWTMPILVFGMNSLAAFVADALVYGPGYSLTVHTANGGTQNLHEYVNACILSLGFNPPNASLIYSLGAVLFCWVLLWLLWRRRIFLKI